MIFERLWKELKIDDAIKTFANKRCVKDLIEEYILGARMRKTNEVKKNVLVRGGRYKEKYFKRLK